MAAVSFSTIRSRFATKVLTIDGFTISRNPFDDFNRNPNAVAHKRTSIGVSMIARSDFDNSMDSVEDVIKALTVRAAPLHTNLQIFFNSANHDITDSGEYIINTLNFTVIHTIALT